MANKKRNSGTPTAVADLWLFRGLVELSMHPLPETADGVLECTAVYKALVKWGSWRVINTVPSLFGDTLEHFATFHRELREVLTAMVELRDLPDESGSHKGVIPAIEMSSIKFFVAPMPNDMLESSRANAPYSDKEATLLVSGSLRDVLWLQMMGIIRSVGIGRLLQCRCGEVFVKTGRREFCSTRCQSRYKMRTRRQAAKALARAQLDAATGGARRARGKATR